MVDAGLTPIGGLSAVSAPANRRNSETEFEVEASSSLALCAEIIAVAWSDRDRLPQPSASSDPPANRTESYRENQNRRCVFTQAGSNATEPFGAGAAQCLLFPDSDRSADKTRMTRRAMYGRRPRCKRNLTFCEAFGCSHVWTAPAVQEEFDVLRSVRVQPCMRPVFA